MTLHLGYELVPYCPEGSSIFIRAPVHDIVRQNVIIADIWHNRNHQIVRRVSIIDVILLSEHLHELRHGVLIEILHHLVRTRILFVIVMA
jgi:hypothetical protein